MWPYEGQLIRAATDAESWAMAVVDHPVLADFNDLTATVDEWDTVVSLLVDADLPVAVYDLAVDVLHPEPVAPTRPPSPYPWRDAGFPNWKALVTELRRRGYDGPVSKTAADLWQILQDRC